MRKKNYFISQWSRKGRWEILRQDEPDPERHYTHEESIGWTSSALNTAGILRWLDKLENEAQHYYDLLLKYGIDPEKQGVQKSGKKPRRMVQTLSHPPYTGPLINPR